MLYLKDPTTKQPSPTLTMVFLGVGGAFLKLFMAGFVCCGIKFSEFTGSDFALVVSPFLALYGHKRQMASRGEDQAKQTTEQRDE